MACLAQKAFAGRMTTTTHPATQAEANPTRPEAKAVIRALRRRSFCTLATASPAGQPHVAGVMYALVDGCFLRITPAGVLHTYGLGLPLRRLVRDPLNAGGRVRWPGGT
jgi:Pyridoxamine 5'-phosphate oxidase